jgi:hypothetical protein
VFVNDSLICLQLQKCASVRLGEILTEQLGGELRGHHERIDIPVGDRRVIASIRDPWSWYVSLWAFGCKGSGGVHYRLTAPRPRRRALVSSVLGRSESGTREVVANLKRDPDVWRRRYSNVDDPLLFREWVRGVLDPENARVLAPAYASSGVADAAGLLTWRYLFLSVRDLAALTTSRQWSVAKLKALDEHENVCTYVMRVDRLATELPAALDAAGVALLPETRAAIEHATTVRKNTTRHRPAAEYYDRATIDLVADREQLILDRYGFVPPEPPGT